MHSWGMIKTKTFMSFVSAFSRLPFSYKLVVHEGAYCHYSRNKIVSGAINGEATHLMLVDGDLTFPPDSVNRLFTHNRDVVGALYYRRQLPKSPTFSQISEGKLYVPEFIPDKPFKVFAMAPGFMLINVEVLKKIPDPWFYFENWNGQELGEDVYFCKKVHEAGFDIWCDPTIDIKHIGDYSY